MINLMVIGSLIALAVGGLLWLILHLVKSDYSMTKVEFGISAAILLAVVIPLTSMVGTNLAFQNRISFNEFWGGYETNASHTVTTCTRDGACLHSYSCDPYTVKTADSYTDKKGHYHPAQYATRYHDCPYSTEEDSFYVDTTLGQYTIAGHIFPDNPQEWRSGSGIPSSVPTGVPAFWSAAKQRLDSNNPGPVSQERTYANYILASNTTILHRFSASIDSYKSRKLMPELVHSVNNFYMLDRVYAVNTNPGDLSIWQNSINRFNAALGAELQGDLYLVIVNASEITDPDDYTGALTAFWESPHYDKDDISKNAIVVVLGTKDGKSIAWARAKTGMPVGNEEMLYDVQNQLSHRALTPDAVLGNLTASVVPKGSKYEVTIHHSVPTQGALESIFWGAHKFDRVCMTCTAPGSHGVGYTYLKHEIEPTATQDLIIYLVIFVLSVAVWCGVVYMGVPSVRSYRSN